jgi:hypothetical protein
MRIRVLSRRVPVLRGPALRWLLLALAAVAAGLGHGAVSAAGEEFVLIRNGKNPVTRLSPGDVKDMAVGKKRVWPDGPVVQMVLGPAGSPELHWLSATLLGAPEATYLARVRQEVFKGEMRRPIVATVERECVDAVATYPGALGVVRAATARRLPPSVSVVSVR